MELEKIKEILEPFLEHNNYYLYDLKNIHEGKNLLLQVLVDKSGGITIDDLVKVNEYLSLELDKIDSDLPNYQLEVSSPGAERDIRNLDELKMAIGSYIYLEKNGMKYVGDFVELKDDEIIVLKVNLKGRFKNFEFKYEEVNKIHYMVKI